MVSELDVIELRVTVDVWDAGTVATVLEARPDSVLVEVADDDGATLATLVVPLTAVSLRGRADSSGHLDVSEDVQRLHRRESAA